MNQEAHAGIGQVVTPIEFSTMRLDAKAPIKRHRGAWPDVIDRLSEPKEHPSKKDCPLIKLVTFGEHRNAKGSLRHDENVQGVYGIEGDYDGGSVALHEAANRLKAAQVEAFLYTTPSHTPDSPRWRVLAPLSSVHLPDQRRDLVSLLNGALGGILSAESWTLSQAFYFGRVKGSCYEYLHVPGMPIDLIDIAIDPVGKPASETTATANSSRMVAPGLDEGLYCTEDTLVDLRLALEHVDADAYHTWVRMGQALKRLGEPGRSLWHDYSARSGKYAADAADAKWETFTGERTGYAAVFAEAQRNGWQNPRKKQHENPQPDRNVIPFSAFCADIEPPRYAWHRVLQYGCLYGLTAKWGHGKTAVMLTVALHAATGRALGGHKMERCRVLYLCGENPADVQLRAIAIAQHYGIAHDELNSQVFFTRRPFAIDRDTPRKQFVAEAAAYAPYGLVIIDTGPAHSAAEEENDNREMHELAMAMRDLMEPLGAPATVALMHPTKEAAKDSLQPRGGGAFSGSIDGELCAWQADGIVEVFHRTKFRGPGFAPMFFKLRAHVLPGVQDNFGDSISTVVAVEAEAGDRPVREPTGKWRLATWRAIQDLIGIGEGWVSVDAVVAKTLEGIAHDPSAGKRDTRRQHVVRAINELAEGYITVENQQVRVRS
jgi:hypothetical protein